MDTVRPVSAQVACGTVQLRLARDSRVDVPGRDPIALGSRMALLLAWLALEGPTPRARMAQMLWPDSAPQAARNALRQRLFNLHRQVGTTLVAGQATLALADGIAHDLDDADDVLAGVDDLGGELGDWLQRQRERRRSRWRDAMAELATLAEKARDYADAMVHARELLALEPLREDAHRRVMRLHYLAGDRAAALLAFDACERMLKDEVGAGPSPETLELLATIERAEAGLPANAHRAVPAALMRPPRLIGREAERRALVDGVAAGALMVLRGDAGMGKSRLLDEVAATLLPAGSAVVVGSRPGDAGLPHSLAVRLLRALLARAGAPAAGGERAALARLLPELGTPDRGHDDAARLRLHAAAQSLLAAAVANGLRAVFIDDLHFADDASATLLQALAGDPGCAWVLACRPDELSDAMAAVLDVQAAASRCRTLSLAPLEGPAIAALLDTLGLPPDIGSPTQAQALRRHAGGNPLYLLETLREALERPSPVGGAAAGAVAWPRAGSVIRLIQRRLSRLSPLASKLVRCAAVAGPDLSAPLAAQVLGLRPLDLADAWAELERGHVLTGGAFVHDLVAEAAREALAAPIACSLHAEVARHVEAEGGEPARIAAHWLAAGEERRAVPHLQAVAHRAQAAWQGATAGRLHEQVAAILGAAGDHGGAARALLAAGVAWAEAQDVDRMLAVAGELDALAEDDEGHAMAAALHAAGLLFRGRFAEAEPVIVAGLTRARRAAADDLALQLLWLQVLLHWERRELADVIRCGEHALALIAGRTIRSDRVPAEDAHLRLTQAVGLAKTSVGRFAEGVALMEDNHARALRGGRTALAASQAQGLALTELERGNGAAARRWIDGALEHLPLLAAPEQAVALRWQAGVATATGRLGEALSASERAVALCAADPSRPQEAVSIAHALLMHTLGRRDLAQRTLAPLRARANLPDALRCQLEAAWLLVGGKGDGPAQLERAVTLGDLSERLRTLVRLQPSCAPEATLPVLTLCATSARDGGAWGLYVEAQAARVAALRALGRAGEARAGALALWAQLDRGVDSMQTFPALAAQVCATLTDASDADLTQHIALRAAAWMHGAASTLPMAWRASYLARSPLLDILPPPARGLLALSAPPLLPTSPPIDS